MMMMHKRIEKLVLTFLTSLLIFSLVNVNVGVVNASDACGNIDLFTQREEPYSGRGLNAESDAFTFGEEVEIYALVTYNNDPLANFPVAFDISGPKNPVENITFPRSAFTNNEGIATVSFRIPTSYETASGEWVVAGNVKIGSSIYQDLLSFKVGWIIEIVSIRTLNAEGLEQEKFALKGSLQAELTVRNIAMTEKIATIALSIHDNSNAPVNSTELVNLPFQHGENLIHTLLGIHESARLGQATLYVCAYTAPVSLGGVPYCPEVSKSFTIVKRDVAIFNVKSSPLVASKGDIVYIDVTVGNKGSEFESFNVSIYFNVTFTGMMAVLNLNPYSNTTVRFAWNTSNAIEGSYLVSAIATTVPDEFDILDNTFYDDVIKLKPIAAPTGWFFPDWFYWLLLLLLIIIIILLILWFYFRRKRKKVYASFHSGWSAWYYRYNVTN
jgi:hypothetical protein